MNGARKRLEREVERDIILAYNIAALSATAQSGKLKSLRHYLPRKRISQAPGEMVELLRSMGAKSDMKIRQVSRKSVPQF